MAVPNLHANTPTGGAVSWDAFSIQYAGRSFGVPGGSTTKRFVWWDYDGGGRTALYTNLATSPIATSYTITTATAGYHNGYYSGDSTPSSVAAGLDGPVINGSTLAYVRKTIKTASVAPSRLVWQFTQLNSDTTTVGSASAFPVTAGHTYRISFYYRLNVAGGISGNMQLNYRFYDASGNSVTTANAGSAAVVAGSWTRWTGTITAPTGTALLALRQATLTGTVTTGDISDVTGLIITDVTDSPSRDLDYFDGGLGISSDPGLLPGWTGSANASTSTLSLPTPSLNAADDVPTTLTDDDVVLIGNKNGIPINIINSTTIDGGLIVDGSVITDALAANSVTSEQILAGAVGTDELAANSITAKKMVMTDLTNLIALADCQDPATRASYSSGVITYVANAGPAGTGDWVARFNATTTDWAVLNIGERIPVAPGQQYRVSWDQKRNGANQKVTVNFWGCGNDGTQTGIVSPSDIRTWETNGGTAPTATVTDGAWATYGGILTIPAGVYQIIPQVKLPTTSDLTGTWDMTNFKMFRAANADLIVDGTIQAVKLNVTQDFTGKNVNGGTFTGGVFQTTSTVGDGSANSAGVKIDPTGLRAFAANSSTPAVLIGADGSASFTGSIAGLSLLSGTLKTATSGRRMEVGHNQSNGSDPSNITFYNGTSGETPGVIGPWSPAIPNTSGGTTAHPALALVSPGDGSLPQPAEIDLISGVTSATTDKAQGAAAWDSEPQAAITQGNLKVYAGDIWTSGRVRQGDDIKINGNVGLSTGVTIYGSPYADIGYSRIGDQIICYGLAKLSSSYTYPSKAWLVSGLPKPIGGRTQAFGAIGTLRGNGPESIYVTLQAVNNVWCICVGDYGSSSSVGGGWLSLSGITYTAD